MLKYLNHMKYRSNLEKVHSSVFSVIGDYKLESIDWNCEETASPDNLAKVYSLRLKRDKQKKFSGFEETIINLETLKDNTKLASIIGDQGDKYFCIWYYKSIIVGIVARGI